MFMRLFLLLSFFLAPFASAQDDMPLRRLLGADEAKAWQAVGRINMEGAGFCTGALIAPDLVLNVMVVSYAQERSEVPSLQERCEMLGRQSAVLVLSCDVNYGASGAPA